MIFEEKKMVKSLYEVLEWIGKKRKTQEKIDALREHDSLAIRIILQGAFDPNVVWLLPEGTPPYTPNELVDQQHILRKEAEKLTYYIKGFHDNLPQVKREAMFIELLERVDPDDAKLLCAIKEKKMPFPGITLEHVTKGLPGLIPE